MHFKYTSQIRVCQLSSIVILHRPEIKVTKLISHLLFHVFFKSWHRKHHLMNYLLQCDNIIDQPVESKDHELKETYTNFTKEDGFKRVIKLFTLNLQAIIYYKRV